MDTAAIIRLAVGFGLLGALVLAEAMLPRRERSQPRSLRWTANLGIAVIDALVARVVLPGGVVAVAAWAQAQGFGLLPALGAPFWLAFLIAFLMLDLTIWAQHRAFHRIPLLWRLHRMHHADVDLDATSGLRFHPIEIVLSLAIKLAVAVPLGAPPEAVLAFEIVLNATSLFNHANLAIPPRVDRVLRWVVVTPDMHRVHHSVHREETDSNFGFNLPWWDRIFGTYRAQPREGHEGMTIGLDRFRAAEEQRLHALLLQPIRSV